MPKHDIIVIGGSAGGIEALQVLAAGFPANLPAAVFVVIHIGNGLNGHSYLPDILSRAGPLPAKQPQDGEEIKFGCIYCARPDFHLQVGPGRIRVVYGPKENFTRPAINPLFRSAAAAYGARVTGVILTGMLDDGVAGLAEVKRKGGVTIAQNPSSALYPSMPVHAIRDVDVDHVVELSHMPALLSRLAETERPDPQEAIESMTRSQTKLTCPECRGPVDEERQGRIVEFRCRVGHTFSRLGVVQEHEATLERSIWEAIVALEEGAEISQNISEGENGAEAQLKREQAESLRGFLKRLKERT